MVDFFLGVLGVLGRVLYALLIRLAVFAIVLLALWYLVAHVVD
jgi:hypothetical protein